MTKGQGPGYGDDLHGAPGYTIAELLVVTVLAVVILAAVVQTLTIQGKGFQHQTTVARSQSNARLALQVLSNELREISATDGDLAAANENALTVRSMRKVGVICHADDAASGTVDVWVLGDEFASGDSVLVFLNNDATIFTDDDWAVGSLGGVADGTDETDCTPWTEYSLTGGAVGSYPTQRLSVSATGGIGGAASGGLVRTFEHITYGLQEIDDVWSLTRQQGGNSQVLVEDLAAPADSGLVFAYVDTAGSDMTIAQAGSDPGSIGRITVTVTAREASPNIALSTDGYHDDVLSTSVFLRNNLITQTDPPVPDDDSGGPGSPGGGGEGGTDDD